jgi:hypothetical protein
MLQMPQRALIRQRAGSILIFSFLRAANDAEKIEPNTGAERHPPGPAASNSVPKVACDQSGFERSLRPLQ